MQLSKYSKLILTSFILILMSQLAFAQKKEDEAQQLPLVQKDDSTYIGEVKRKNFRFTPFIAPSVSPEMGLLISAGGLISFSFQEDDPELQTSSIPFSFGYSTTGAINANIKPSLFFKGDKNRITSEFWYRDMPDNYWGVGYQNARSPSSPDSTTSYNRQWYQVLIRYTHKFGKNFYAGVLADFNATETTELSNEIANDPNVLKDGTQVQNNSIGLLFQYDSRDFTVNAYEGLFLELSSNFYGNRIFGEKNYKILILDYRQYKQIKRPGRTLAWQVKSRIGFQDVPWTEMSLLGSPFDLRGYYWGRYRDKAMMLGLFEYRHMFMRKKPRKKDGSMMSRFGFVTWVGTGSVAPRVRDVKYWLPNYGVGLRFEVHPRMNARIDMGFGDDTQSFYISFNEAF